jgi:DNA-binding transcriptional ArsR family regulator
VSHHLALMRTAGFIEMRRDGKHNFYRIQPSRFHEFGQVVYSVLPTEVRAWQSSDLTVAPASGASSAVNAPTASGTSGA